MKTDKKFKDLEAKAEEYLAGWKRAQADYHNLKKEHESQMKRIRDLSAIGFAEQLLPVIDHYDLAINHVPEKSKDEEWVKGFYHIKKQFDDMLQEFGIQKIKTIGEQFSPELHEAVSSEESDKDEGTVIKEVQAGYCLNQTIIRPAKVIVSK